MAAQFTFEVHTPYRLFYSGPVEAIVLTLVDGEIAIYANHNHISAPVVPCLLKIKDKDGNWKTAFSSDGILEVTSNKTVLVTDSAEWPKEIDCERAKAAKARAVETLKEEGLLKFEAKTAATALRRAEMRLKARESEPTKKT